MSIELVPLCTITVTLAEPIFVSPGLVIGEVEALRAEGERFNASMKGSAAADWFRPLTADYGQVDVRCTFITDDGAIVFASYLGRLVFETMTVFTTPLFHTGDERYAWMNKIQAVAKGHFESPTTLVYEVFELR